MIRIVLFCLASISHVAFAQVDYQRQYANAKDLFQSGKYNLAMESFKPLIAYAQGNAFSEYASFYYAVAAYRQGYKSVAKDMLLQMKKVHTSWDKLQEVDFWLARIYFDDRQYFQALKVLAAVTDRSLSTDVENLKLLHLRGVEDIETLRMMHEEFPKDAVVAKQLANLLSRNMGDPENRAAIEKLIDQFKFKRTDFIPEAPKTVMKDKYAVAVFLPFAVATLEPTPSRKRNQIVLDFYEGMKLAQDTLLKQGVQIDLRAYDSERNSEKIKKLLETEEIKRSDLIVGPLFPEENKVVQSFSGGQRINTFHPFSNNTEMISENPFGFLFQPSSEAMGRKAADHLIQRARGNKTMVFYGTGKKDSVLAANYIAQAQQHGMKLLRSEKINGNKETIKITDILSTPTEFDEFKYPSQFTLPKDSLHSVFVASDDPLIYTKVVGAVEMRGDSIRVVGSENWLEDNAIDLDKYQSLGISLISPNYWNVNTAHYKEFNRRFLAKHGRLASNIARMGYEFMMFTGTQLKTNGVYFQDALQSGGILPGFLSEGFDYRYSRDNQLVPFVTIKKGQLMLIEKR